VSMRLRTKVRSAVRGSRFASRVWRRATLSPTLFVGVTVLIGAGAFRASADRATAGNSASRGASTLAPVPVRGGSWFDAAAAAPEVRPRRHAETHCR
jgi:hypothetical protein